MAADNKSLGRFILDGIPPAPRGIPQIEVAFDIDANGILNVTAKDKATGKERSIKITGSTGLAKDEIEKMTKEAEEHADEDKQKKEKIEARNLADNLIFTAEKTLKDAGEKVSGDDKKVVEEKIKELKETISKEDAVIDEIKKKTEELSGVLQKVGAQMYASTSPGQGGSTGATQDQQPAEEESKKEKKSKKKDEAKKEEAEEGEVVNE